MRKDKYNKINNVRHREYFLNEANKCIKKYEGKEFTEKYIYEQFYELMSIIDQSETYKIDIRYFVFPLLINSGDIIYEIIPIKFSDKPFEIHKYNKEDVYI